MSYKKREHDNDEQFNLEDEEFFSDVDSLNIKENTVIVKRGTHKKSFGFKLLSVILSIILVVSIIGLAGTVFAYVFLNQLNIVETDNNYEIIEEEELPTEEGDNSALADAPKSEIEILEKLISSNVDENVSSVMSSDQVYNILLIGSDSRSEKERGRSDTMIIASINKKTKKIYFTSILRDTYVALPERMNNRINAAYAFGGAEMLMDTIELNFKIKIDRYMAVDFRDFINIIDIMDGVDITLSEQEVDTVNKMAKGYCKSNGLAYNFSDLKAGQGERHLNGIQALMYSRIRKSDSDFVRTGRQRQVLGQLISKSKGKAVTEIYSLSKKLMPLVTTNVSDDELLYLLLQAPSYFDYDIVEQQVPMNDTYSGKRIRGMAVLGIYNFDKNISMLQDTVFEETDPTYGKPQKGENQNSGMTTGAAAESRFKISSNIFVMLFSIFIGTIVVVIALIVVVDKASKKRAEKYKVPTRKYYKKG